MSAPVWDGVPLNPERDGAHVLSWRRDDPEQAWWIACDKDWMWKDRDTCSYITAGNNAIYLGPCILPADHAAAVEAAVQAERAACADWCADALNKCHDGRRAAREACTCDRAGECASCSTERDADIQAMCYDHALTAIRARGPTDALAAALAKAREEALREAAHIAQDRESEGGEYAMAARHIAAAIRALAGKEQGK